MAAAELDFCLLGPLAVGGGELRLPALPAKQRVLLATLLLNANRMVSVDQLAEITWGPAPPASARATLRNYVEDLRKALSGLGASRISTLPGGYLIRVGDDELDLSGRVPAGQRRQGRGRPRLRGGGRPAAHRPVAVARRAAR